MILIMHDLEIHSMKKLFQPKLLPILALTGGLGAMALRFWLLSAGLDHKGLLRTDHPANKLVFLLTGLVLLAICLCVQTPVRRRRYQRLFPVSLPAAVGCWVAAAGVCLNAVSQLLQQTSNTAALCAVLAFVAAGALILLGRGRLVGKRPKWYLHAAICLYFAFHLLVQYRPWSRQTQLTTYFFPLLAGVFLMFAAFHAAVLAHSNGKSKVFLFFHYGALFFCCAAIADHLPLFYFTMAVWTATVCCDLRVASVQDSMPLPRTVQRCLHLLNEAGCDAYVVGGCVRDHLLGLEPQDYDICTNATPEQTAQIFAKYQLVRNGEKHGTIGVVIDSSVYEITTFRTESTYSDSRHPDSVSFVSRLSDDLARRDFTVNAIAYCPEQGFIDPWNGQADLQSKCLRTVGVPAERFAEDPLRILRGVRFAARFHLDPDPDTLQAMLTLAPAMESLAQERIFAELCKLITVIRADDLVRYQPVLTQVIPELLPCVGFDQHNSHHAYDVYTHIAHTVAHAPQELTVRLAALLHDIGKPSTFTLDAEGCGHFYDHAKVSAQMADLALQRLRAPTALRQQVVVLITHHMLMLTPDTKLLRRRVMQFGGQTVQQLLALQLADRASRGTGEPDPDTPLAQRLFDQLLEQDSCLQLRDLAINGDDLIALGFTPGPVLGKTLSWLLELVVDQQIPNERVALLTAAEVLLEQPGSGQKEETE